MLTYDRIETSENQFKNVYDYEALMLKRLYLSITQSKAYRGSGVLFCSDHSENN